MIVVSVILISANTGKATELARMNISNIGGDHDHRDYKGETLIGRSTEAFEANKVNRTGHVLKHPSEAVHVWNLVAKMLRAMRYG